MKKIWISDEMLAEWYADGSLCVDGLRRGMAYLTQHGSESLDYGNFGVRIESGDLDELDSSIMSGTKAFLIMKFPELAARKEFLENIKPGELIEVMSGSGSKYHYVVFTAYRELTWRAGWFLSPLKFDSTILTGLRLQDGMRQKELLRQINSGEHFPFEVLNVTSLGPAIIKNAPIVDDFMTIPGVSPATAGILKEKYGTVESMRDAGAASIAARKGISHWLAIRIMEHLNSSEENGE